MLVYSSKLPKRLLVIFLFLSVQACHPPVFNQLIEHRQNVASWQGSTANKLVAVRGKPFKIYYLGELEVTLISSEFWTPELDRFETLYRPFTSSIKVEQNANSFDDLYRSRNSKGEWLFVYKSALTTNRFGYKECTEYYLINKNGVVLMADILGTSIGDQRYCYAPRRNRWTP